MPSKSKSQQRFFGTLLSYKKGEKSRDEVSKTIADKADSMSLQDIEDFAATKHKGLPESVEKKRGKKKKKTKSVKESRFIMNFEDFKKV